MREVRVALVQAKVVFSDAAENLASAERLINGINEPFDIAVLPECFDLGWANPKAEKLAMTIPSATTERLCAMARDKNIHIVAGITERENGRIYNTAILIDNNGNILGKHRKINILTEVEYVYSVGTSVSVYDTVFGKIGMTICADNFVNSLMLAESMARMGCDLILSPCSWAVNEEFLQKKKVYGAEWVEPYKKVADTYKVPVVGVSNVGLVTVGEWKGHSCIGNSMVAEPDSDVMMLPFGVDAECTKVVGIRLYDRPALGTKLSGSVSIWQRG